MSQPSLCSTRPAALATYSRPGSVSTRPKRSRLQDARRAAVQPRAFFSLFDRFKDDACPEEEASPSQEAMERLLLAIDGSEKGLNPDAVRREAVLAAAAELAQLGVGQTTTDANLSGTWKLLWTTEKETLFILQRASWFGTAAGEVYQVIDTEDESLQNVITFPPKGAFIVDSSIKVMGQQRTEFQFTAATLKLPGDRVLQLPPFGKGWFDTVYMDSEIRVAQDSRGDTLVVARDGAPRRFS